MTFDALLPELERLESQGAVVVLKWDGERTNKKRTVVITRAETDYVYRKDADVLESALIDAIADYDRAHRAS